ncbi:MAG: CHASE2 domain-containing protein, partial [Burkholderiaceae bacterium]|nr:CHASE2 domain-containing protein [Burkholderiaceae bacterium]
MGLLLLAAVLAVAAGLLWPQAVQRLDHRLHDLGWHLLAHRAANSLEERLVLVDIDELSLAALGPWPWPRARLAALADRLGANGVALQVWDVVLDADRPD